MRSLSTSVRFVGQPVAVVLAESQAQRERAANLVQVDYDALPAVASLDAALAPSAPLRVAGRTGQRRR